MLHASHKKERKVMLLTIKYKKGNSICIGKAAGSKQIKLCEFLGITDSNVRIKFQRFTVNSDIVNSENTVSEPRTL
jgi:hypothetical protein